MPDFFVPERFHASHLFLAAPPETAPETVQAKQSAIEALSVRLAAGEDFATLVAQSSEDEATKLRGGDLGWFTTNRMPPDFVAAAMKLQPGEISGPIRTRLGFHIIKLVEMQSVRQRSFDEVRGDIALELANQNRAAIVQRLMVDLDAQAKYLRPF
jgi:peptidyl-prolyl cis-trans isomerase C